MVTRRLKKYETIGSCGIDCGLCPRYYTKGDSACPGCGGLCFNEKHPACACLTCCAVKNGFEVCSCCNEFPCKQFEPEKSGYDSFVTHQRIMPNLYFIKENGIDEFLEQQKIRMEILAGMLANFDEGRSKSFFCLSCALLPLDKLLDLFSDLKADVAESVDLKDKSKKARTLFTDAGKSLSISLRLNKK
ncbi:MAG: DUF3795 domain-containing protein [Salinivirgaceae bacterium]